MMYGPSCICLAPTEHATPYTFLPVRRSEVDVTIQLYATKSEVGRYILDPGMRHVATMTLDLPPGWSQGVARASYYTLQVRRAYR